MSRFVLQVRFLQDGEDHRDQGGCIHDLSDLKLSVLGGAQGLYTFVIMEIQQRRRDPNRSVGLPKARISASPYLPSTDRDTPSLMDSGTALMRIVTKCLARGELSYTPAIHTKSGTMCCGTCSNSDLTPFYAASIIKARR